MFRGYLLKLLSGNGRVLAVVLTSALFSAAHFWQGVNLMGWLNIFLFGVLATQLYFLSRSLWMPAGFHIAWNFVQMSGLGFPVYGRENSGLFQVTLLTKDLVSGGAYGPEGSLVTTLLLVLSIGFAHWMTGRGSGARSQRSR